ncbi:hypothetical protein B0H13DRAFT_2062326 [Mycena leptocephala]|nr:hypothetical protein B0H13DRAFT_2062326 [Mycena leptocephala]
MGTRDELLVLIFVFEGTRTRCVVPFCCCVVDCIIGGGGKFCMPGVDVDAGERLDFAGTRRPEIVRARVVGGDAEALVVLLLLPLPLPLGAEPLVVRAEGTPLGGRRWERGGGSGAGILALCSMPPASSCVPSPSQSPVQTQVKGSRSRVALTLGGEYEFCYRDQAGKRTTYHVRSAYVFFVSPKSVFGPILPSELQFLL